MPSIAAMTRDAHKNARGVNIWGMACNKAGGYEGLQGLAYYILDKYGYDNALNEEGFYAELEKLGGLI